MNEIFGGAVTLSEIQPSRTKPVLSYTNVIGFIVVHLVALTAIFLPEYTFLGARWESCWYWFG